MGELEGLLLDRLDIEVDNYRPTPALLNANHDEAPVEETLVSHLLKSNCLVTGQPDWASVQIRYVGPQIDQEGLLQIPDRLPRAQRIPRTMRGAHLHGHPAPMQAEKLAVYARYTRRGGLDINPWRSNFSTGQAPFQSCAMRASNGDPSSPTLSVRFTATWPC